MAETSPTARALLTLELLQGQPGITAERLASRLGVTERATRRYVAILREAGIPVSSVSGRAGGYRLGRGLRLPPLMFSPEEALGLVMAVLDGHHAASEPTQPVGSALGKLLRALPERVAAQAEAVRRTVAPAPDGGAVRPDPTTTVALVAACAESRVTRVGYRSARGTEFDVDVEPWAVVVRHGRWYLLCHALSSGAVRAYRVDRVRHVEPLDTLFTPPEDLDPVVVLEEHLASGWSHEVELELDAPLSDLARWLPRGLGRLEAVDDGTTRLVGTTDNITSYAEMLAQLTVSWRVVRGEEVRAAVRTLGERMVAAAEG
ncbi:helix-turn-helix transcriptional regulator [Nocardioides euryhalodurans]|uniref:WYL domain-containing protein n=1 Tax=Nocardioides euryhalodurans TaxID=2518370 RepID=A0A4P7GLZ4_9ACTN|nr:WYL domain-containing protein [Nocardioides euryhalodurans]QBR92777.1 WYL domain-containing protein [Nocardioides euryhalodurans]